EVSRAQRPAESPHHNAGLLSALGECVLQLRAESAVGGEGESHASAGLVIMRIGESHETHFLEDSSDAFSSFESDSEIGADSSNSRVAGVSSDIQGAGRIGEPWETTRT